MAVWKRAGAFSVDLVPTSALAAQTAVAQQSTQPAFDWPWLDATHTWTGGPHGWDHRCAAVRCIGTEIPAIKARSGLDFGQGDWQVHPMAQGNVVYAGSLPGTLGSGVVVDHGDDWQTVYAHMATESLHAPGPVMRDDVLGLSDCSGDCGTGPHLHVDLRHGARRNADGTLVYGTPVSWDDLTVAGWRIEASALNYDGTATRDGVAVAADRRGTVTFTAGIAAESPRASAPRFPQGRWC